MAFLLICRSILIRALALSLLLFLSLSAQALVLVEWRPSASLPAIVLPVRDGELPKDAALRYLISVAGDAGLQPLLSAEPMPDLSLTGFSALSDKDIENRVLLLANRPSDYLARYWRVESFREPFAKAGVTSYLAPFAYDAGLTESEAKTYRELVDVHFSHFLAMGGSDVDPEIFGQLNTHSMDVNPRRDRAEALLIQQKTKSIARGDGPHRLTAICRGAQLAARVLGYGVGQHIPADLPDALRHGGGSERPVEGKEPMHPAKVLNTSAGLLLRDLNGKHEMLVNTYHHQHILWTPGGELELAAISPDGVTEALESKDGRIRLFQFHPELMRVRSRGILQYEGDRIMQSIARPEQVVHAHPSCRAVFTSL